jgi:hypothetical protein
VPQACESKTRDGTVGHPTAREKPDRLSGILNPDQLIRPRPAEPIKASGHVKTAPAGRTHDCKRPVLIPKKALASGGPSTHEAAHFSPVETDPNVVLRFDPAPFTTEIIIVEIAAARRPYSTAVAPDSSLRKARICRFIHER